MLTHIRLEHADQLNFRIQCNLQGCKRTFKKFTVYRNHIYHYHDIIDDKLTSFEFDGVDDENNDGDYSPRNDADDTCDITADSLLL